MRSSLLILAPARRLRRLGGRKASFGIDYARHVVPVTVPHPVGQVVARTGFVAPLRSEVEIHVGSGQHFVSSAVRGIGVEDLTGPILVEDADSRKFFAYEFPRLVVVIDLSRCDFLLCERHVIVIVEVAVIRREPAEAPTHALFESLDLCEWCSRNRHERYIMMLEVCQCAVDVIGAERTAHTAFFPAGTEHEMGHDELTPILKE